jgi:hypothetical protein
VGAKGRTRIRTGVTGRHSSKSDVITPRPYIRVNQRLSVLYICFNNKLGVNLLRTLKKWHVNGGISAHSGVIILFWRHRLSLVVPPEELIDDPHSLLLTLRTEQSYLLQTRPRIHHFVQLSPRIPIELSCPGSPQHTQNSRRHGGTHTRLHLALLPFLPQLLPLHARRPSPKPHISSTDNSTG